MMIKYIFILFIIYLLKKQIIEGNDFEEIKNNFSIKLENDMKDLINEDNNLDLNVLIFYSMLFDVHNFTYDSFLELSSYEKDKIFTEDTIENKLFLRDKLKEKYTSSCMSLSFEDCLQNINQKYIQQVQKKEKQERKKLY